MPLKDCKYIDSDHLCYIYVASYPSPADVSPQIPYILLFKLVQKTCTKLNMSLISHMKNMVMKMFSSTKHEAKMTVQKIEQ